MYKNEDDEDENYGMHRVLESTSLEVIYEFFLFYVILWVRLHAHKERFCTIGTINMIPQY